MSWPAADPPFFARPVLVYFLDPPTAEIYTLSLHDALPICRDRRRARLFLVLFLATAALVTAYGLVMQATNGSCRSEEHTSELQSRQYLVCRLLLEKKKQ